MMHIATYSCILSCCFSLTGNAQRPEAKKSMQSLIRKTLDDALQAARDIPDSESRATATAAIADLMARTGDRARAKETIEQAIRDITPLVPTKPNEQFQLVRLHLTTIPLHMLPTRDWKWVIAHVEKATSQPWTKQLSGLTAEMHRNMVLQSLAAAQAEAGEKDAAHATIQSMPDDRRRDRAYAFWAQAMVRKKEWSAALAALDKVDDSLQRAAVEAELAGALVAAGKRDEAAKHIATAHNTLDQVLRLTRTAFTNPTKQALAPAYAAIGDGEKALAVAHSIRNVTPISPSREETLARVYVKLGDFKKAAESARQARELNPSYELPLREVAVALAEAKKFAEAGNLIAETKNPTWRTLAWVAIARIRHKQGDRDEADAILQRVLAETQNADAQNPAGSLGSANVYRTVAQAQAAFRQEAQARTWIDRLKIPNDRAWALLGLAEGLNSQ